MSPTTTYTKILQGYLTSLTFRPEIDGCRSEMPFTFIFHFGLTLAFPQKKILSQHLKVNSAIPVEATATITLDWTGLSCTVTRGLTSQSEADQQEDVRSPWQSSPALQQALLITYCKVQLSSPLPWQKSASSTKAQH